MWGGGHVHSRSSLCRTHQPARAPRTAPPPLPPQGAYLLRAVRKFLTHRVPPLEALHKLHRPPRAAPQRRPSMSGRLADALNPRARLHGVVGTVRATVVFKHQEPKKVADSDGGSGGGEEGTVLTAYAIASVGALASELLPVPQALATRASTNLMPPTGEWRAAQC